MRVFFISCLNDHAEGLLVKNRISVYFKERDIKLTELFISKKSPQIEINKLILNINTHDVVLTEISNLANTQIGFLLGIILANGRPVILLYRDDDNPALIEEYNSSKLVKSEYNDKNLEEVIAWCLDEASFLIASRRFTFFISPDIEVYLNKVSRILKVTKSQFIRDLIKKEMRNRLQQ